MNNLLWGELMYALFPHMARTIEGLAEGWVTYQSYNDPPQDTIDVIEAVIREMGIRRHHTQSDWFRYGTDDALRAYVAQFLGVLNVDQTDARLQLQQPNSPSYRVVDSSDNGMVLRPEALFLRPASPDRSGYRCPQCNAFYLHNVRICPSCSAPGQAAVRLEAGSPRDDFDYYSLLTAANVELFRMNCDELTGQTDVDDRTARQRRFQSIFLNGEIEQAQGVDLLSVTTTMEAGVDIGALNVVQMANMPPRRFNYQQRVGRAGRRSSGVSLAITFCRGRSHDDFYYQRPEMITGDTPPQPYVEMSSETILKRVLIKETLRRGFDGIPLSPNESVHGEFGKTDEWDSGNAIIVRQFLQDPANASTMATVVRHLATNTRWDGNSAFVAQLVDYLTTHLANDIQSVVDDPMYTQEHLSERLANAGLLPMFGYPTRIRLLHTKWNHENGLVDRNLDIAISSFAPGAQTVKEKAVHTAMGVVELKPGHRGTQSEDGLFPPLPGGNSNPVGLCGHCRALVTRNLPALANPAPGGVDVQPTICPVCSETELRVLDAREPKGFVTNLHPDDFEGQFEWSPRSTHPAISIQTDSPLVQFVSNNAEVASLTDHIVSVNDNDGVGGFDFQQAATNFNGQRVQRNGAWAVDLGGTGQQLPTDLLVVNGPAYRIALMSRRLTDILLVRLPSWPQGIAADPTLVEGRGAWYSFAFFMRLAAGVFLDVDSQELQCGLRTVPENGVPTGQAFLCDQLENGAGYCRYLGQSVNFDSVMSQAINTLPNTLGEKWLASGGTIHHGDDCDTSCSLCLRDFSNQPFHGLLDWRLALDMARLALDSAAVLDLSTAWNGVSNPWARLVEGTDAPVACALADLGFEAATQFCGLNGFVQPALGRVVIVRHPLWTDDHPGWQASYSDATSRHPGSRVIAMNPFRLIRRPADCLV